MDTVLPALASRELTVTVVSTTTTGDRYGDATVQVTRTPIDGVLFAPRGLSSHGYSEERVNTTSPTVYVAASLYFRRGLPDGVTLDSDDSIEITNAHPLINGTYQVEGIPGYWGGPVEVAVTRTGPV